MRGCSQKRDSSSTVTGKTMDYKSQVQAGRKVNVSGAYETFLLSPAILSVQQAATSLAERMWMWKEVLEVLKERTDRTRFLGYRESACTVGKPRHW